jgi:hypothetical protein
VPGSSRRETLVSAYRQAADCQFTIDLTLHRDKDAFFAEQYVYFPRSGDSGREYAYGLRIPYSAIGTLIAFFDKLLDRTTSGDPEQRLIDCFQALVARGELADGMALREPRDRVQRWCEQAGVPARRDDFAW